MGSLELRFLPPHFSAQAGLEPSSSGVRQSHVPAPHHAPSAMVRASGSFHTPRPSNMLPSIIFSFPSIILLTALHLQSQWPLLVISPGVHVCCLLTVWKASKSSKCHLCDSYFLVYWVDFSLPFLYSAFGLHLIIIFHKSKLSPGLFFPSPFHSFLFCFVVFAVVVTIVLFFS